MSLPIMNQNPLRTGISMTNVAADKVKELLAQRGTPEHGLRVERERSVGHERQFQSLLSPSSSTLS